MTAAEEQPDETVPEVSDYVEPEAEIPLEEQLTPEHGYISVAACNAVFRDTDYKRMQYGSHLSMALGALVAGALLKIRSEEDTLRDKIIEYCASIAQHGTEEQKHALETALHIPNAANRFLFTYFLNQRRKAEEARKPFKLSAEEQQQWERVKILQPINTDELFGVQIGFQTRHNQSNHLDTISAALAHDPVLSKIPFRKEFPPLPPIPSSTTLDIEASAEALYELAFLYMRYDALRTSMTWAGKIDFHTLHRTQDEKGRPCLAFRHQKGSETVDAANPEAELKREWALGVLDEFCRTFNPSINFSTWNDPTRLEFRNHGLSTPALIQQATIDTINGDLPLDRKQDQIYGTNFPKFSDFHRLKHTKCVSNATYPNPVMNKYPLLIDQLDVTLKLIGYEDAKLSLNDAHLKPIRDIMKVLHAIRARDGAYGSYLGEQASRDAIYAHNKRLDKKPVDEGYLEPKDHPDSILFNDEIIAFDYQALEHAIAEAKIAAERFGDARLRKDFGHMLQRLEGYMASTKTTAQQFMEGEILEIDDTTVKPVFSAFKRSTAEREIYEVSIIDAVAKEKYGLKDAASLAQKKHALLTELKGLIEESAYCERVRPAIAGDKLMLTDPPPYIAQFLDSMLMPAKGIATAMDELQEKVAATGKKFQLGKIKTDPKTKLQTVTLLNPAKIAPREREHYYTSLLDAIEVQFPKEKHPGMKIKTARMQDLSIENAPPALIGALQQALGVAVGQGQGQ